MTTVFAIGFLILCGVIANFLAVFALNLAGLPGALAAGRPSKRSKTRFLFGCVIAALGQSYVYLAFTAFVVSWTKIAAARGDVFGLAVWPVAFLAVAIPIWLNVMHALSEGRESEHANPQVEALHLMMLAALLGFLVFAFAPVIMRLGWAWVPYVA